MITKKYYKMVRVSHEDSGYFYIKNITDQTGTLSFKQAFTLATLEYSTDGVNWTSYDLTNHPDIPVSPNSNIYFRGTLSASTAGSSYITFNMNVDHYAGGNAYSIVDKNNFTTMTSSSKQREFALLFKNDTHLIDASKLNFGNVTTLRSDNNGTFSQAFYGCTSLIAAPAILPFTTLSQICFDGMFEGCTSLTTSPELPATTFTNSSYSRMFYGCTSLNSIKCMADNQNTNFNNWVYNVAANGTFYKNPSSNWPTGASGIPSGWTVVNA